MKTRGKGVCEAEAGLSGLTEKVGQDQFFGITHRGRRHFVLRPAARRTQRPKFGCDKGRVVVGKDFDDPIPGMDEYGA